MYVCHVKAVSSLFSGTFNLKWNGTDVRKMKSSGRVETGSLVILI